MLLKHSPSFYVCEHSLNMWSDNKFKCLILCPSYAVSWFRFLQIWGLQKQLPKGVTEAATLRKRCSENMQQIYSRTPFLFLITKAKKKKKNTLVSGNAGDEKNLHPGNRKFIFLNWFSGDILFSFLVPFAFLGSCFFLLLFVYCFFKLKMYNLIHIRLSGRVSDKKIVTRLISGNKITFFWKNVTICLFRCSFFLMSGFKLRC